MEEASAQGTSLLTEFEVILEVEQGNLQKSARNRRAPIRFQNEA
jgi:hypothetical protein